MKTHFLGSIATISVLVSIWGCAINVGNSVASNNQAKATVDANVASNNNVASGNKVDANIASKNAVDVASKNNVDVNAIVGSRIGTIPTPPTFSSPPTALGPSSTPRGSAVPRIVAPSPELSVDTPTVLVSPSASPTPGLMTPSAKAPGIVFDSYSFFRATSPFLGNYGDKIRRGDSGTVTVKIKNVSSSRIQVGKWALVMENPSDTQGTMKGAPGLSLPSSTLDPGQSDVLLYVQGTFDFDVALTCPPGHVFTFDLYVTDTSGVDYSDKFSIVIP
jgi:hypothetical protein